MKKPALFILVSIIYILFVSVFLRPWELKHFSLIDDGEAFIQNYHNITSCLSQRNCNDLSNQIVEKQFGRFRPMRWVIDASIYEIFGNNIYGMHMFKIYGVGLSLILLLIYFLIRAKANSIVIIFCCALLTINFSFIETVIRMGPDEPYQLLLIGMFSVIFLYVNKFKAISTILLGMIFFVKETSIALVPAILNYGRRFQSWMTILFATITIVFIYLSRSSPSTFVYSDNYGVNVISIFNSIGWYLQVFIDSLKPISYIILFVIPFVLYKPVRKKIWNKEFKYWLIIFLSFTAIVLPWKYQLERYVLIPVFALLLIGGIILSEIVDVIKSKIKNRKITVLIFNVVTVFVLINIFFIFQSGNIARAVNYSSWYKKFLQFESEQVEGIVSIGKGPVYINAKDTIDNWEVLYEIPMHIKYFYGGKTAVERVGEKTPTNAYIFSRSSLDPAIDEDILKNAPIVVSGKKEISQINIIEFSKLFVLRPIQTLQNPPMSKDLIFHYWEIRKMK